MWDELGEYSEALENTTEIAKRCEVEIQDRGGALVMPKFEPPEDASNFEYLRELSYQGAWQRYYDHAGELEGTLRFHDTGYNRQGYPFSGGDAFCIDINGDGVGEVCILSCDGHMHAYQRTG